MFSTTSGGETLVEEGSCWVDASLVVAVNGIAFGGSAEFWEEFTRGCGNFVRREGRRIVYRAPLDLTKLL
jgi:hypothetical protein